jgi:large repetitive protein
MIFRSLTLLIAVLSALFGLAAFTWSLAAASPAEPGSQANLRINEFMADNKTTLEDPDEPGEFPDWIELYNAGPTEVTLDGLYLTDNPDRPTRFAITTGLTIPAGGFLLFYADNDPRQGALHLNFALSRHGGFVGIFDAASDSYIDSYTYGPQEPDVSEGRAVDGSDTWRFFVTPTPGATNNFLPPIISNVQQTPTVPAATDGVTITATVVDERELAEVTLYYIVTELGEVAVPMSATGDLYSAQIPPLPDRTLVGYYLVATDIDGLSSRLPRAAQQPYRYMVGFQAPILYINEIMADNKGILTSPADPSVFPDWFEIYNPGPNAVSLDGLFLTDNRNSPTRYPIPSGLMIPPGEYLVFYADNQPEQGPLHTNFALSRDGEYLAIYANAELEPIDEIDFGATSPDVAWVRYPDGGDTWVQSACITPGAANAPCDVQGHLPWVSN